MIFILGVVDLISGCGVPLIWVKKVEGMKLLRLWFCFLLHSIYILSYIQNNFSYELARPIMGIIFLVIIIIMNKSQELTVFHGRQKLTSAKN